MDIYEINITHYEQKSALDHFVKWVDLKETEKKVIEKYFKREGKILDLGCGSGRTTKILFEKGFKVTGVDIGENMIAEAKKISPKIDYRVGDACDLKFKDKSFDLVFFSCNGLDYLYPFPKRIKGLKEINRVLKDDGYLVYSSHNPLSLFFRIRPKFILKNLLKGTLFSRYKLEEDPYGPLYTQYASPRHQLKTVEKSTNLKFVEIVDYGLRDLHPHYIFRKKIA